MSDNHDITVLLKSASEGDAASLDALFNRIYPELHRLAHLRRRQWHGQPTLNTTALVHEAFEKLARSNSRDAWDCRAHFFATAARAMRQILMNYARERQAQKRGGPQGDLPLDDNPIPDYDTATELLDLDRALTRLAEAHERAARVVECRFFAGMTVDETAEALNISPATIKRDWQFAAAWLGRELGAFHSG